jgi:uncharacterized protein YfdQ (DUF2303 family)
VSDGTELNTIFPANVESSVTDVRTIAELGALSTKPRIVEDGKTYVVPGKDGGVELVKVPDEAEHPLGIKAARTVTDARSFIDYVNRHSDEHTEIWADQKRSTIVAVIDSHASAEIILGAGGRPGYERHKLTLTLEHTPSWLAWAKLDREQVAQEVFAEHIEENIADVLKPAAADLLELAQTFQATRGVEFGQSTRLSNGEFQIVYSETLDGKAGRKGDVVIPDEILLGLIPYLGGEGYQIPAKFRWRLRDSVLTLGYSLVRPDVILEKAFADVLNVVRAGITDRPIFLGRP